MKAVFSKTLNALFGRKKSFKAPIPSSVTVEFSSQPLSNERNQKSKATKEAEEKAQVNKCQRILNYWLDAELFDIPKCPMYNDKDLLSIPLDDYETKITDDLTQQLKEGKKKISDKSRLMIMFQCHRAGYIAKDSEKHPNEELPRTYLVAQSLIPSWNEDLQTITWRRSEDKSDLIVNIAAIRTLYRRCCPPSATNMDLSDWVEARIEHIENTMARWLQTDENDSSLTSRVLQNNLHELNRILSKEFWPHEAGKSFMLNQCQSIESSYQDTDTPWKLKRLEDEKKLKPIEKSNGDITFRWRFCFYPEGSEQTQLGPFFVQDLESNIKNLTKFGMKGLSSPLATYLLGKNKQTLIPEAVNNGNFYFQHTNSRLLGRWPENPKFGLSLLQSLSVNVSLDKTQNPIVAVNGPPGTGKTTLLKDVIADKFVRRSHTLLNLIEKDDWQDDTEVIKLIMDSSVVVASSNNKAVENISKELPASKKISTSYLKTIEHFTEVAPSGDWGLFCAVLGKSSNRSTFKQKLKKLKIHLKTANNVFQLNELVKALDNTSRDDAGTLIIRFVTKWKDDGHLPLLAADVLDSYAAQNAKSSHPQFLVPFADALLRIHENKLSFESFQKTWSNFTDEQWALAKQAITTFKKQWFGAKKGNKYIQAELNNAKEKFSKLYAELSTADLSKSEWELNNVKLLANPMHFNLNQSEEKEQLEKRLQKAMPFGSKPLNHKRSELFVAALKFNEALLKSVGAELASEFDELEQLIEGSLESNEKIPQHQKLWSRLFMFYPVISTSLYSVESQFKLMQKTGGFGLVVIDEAGQAVNYHVAGLLQRSQQAIFVGDPIQLEPVVTCSQSIDLSVAEDFMPVSRSEGESEWGDNYLISNSSAQTLADRAGNFMSYIGDRKVGIPLLVHRRCVEPMFSIANKVAYDNKMVSDTLPFEWKGIQSGWINVEENSSELNKRGYNNQKEAKLALELVKYLVESESQMLQDGVYIITPFTAMKDEVINQCRQLLKNNANLSWLAEAFGSDIADKELRNNVLSENIGTVHTFQGKEASTVILCCSASEIRQKTGGISWVNSKPNLINVAVTRAKHHLFILGNATDWSTGKITSELQSNGMKYYTNIDVFKSETSLLYSEMTFIPSSIEQNISDITFKF